MRARRPASNEYILEPTSVLLMILIRKVNITSVRARRLPAAVQHPRARRSLLLASDEFILGHFGIILLS